jgi:hypothetical protein
VWIAGADILVSSEHLPAAVRLAVLDCRWRPEAERLIHLRRLGKQHDVKRIRQMHMKPGAGCVDPFAEALDDAFFVRRDRKQSKAMQR